MTVVLPRRSRPQPRKPGKSRKNLLYERILAMLALLNLGLVFFDLSYIPLRDFYLRELPSLTRWYGERFKGIEPHRLTESYLNTVNQLINEVPQRGLRSPEATLLLGELRSLSAAMIDENPFESANKSGALERVKNQMRDRIGEESAKAAFEQFWSTEHLTTAGWAEEIAFFDRQIRPLIATNYFRRIGETGRPLDLFWQLDLWFVLIFAADYLARTFYLSRRYKGTSWLDTMLWRWYDLLLLLPFWRWLRIIPVTIRLSQAKLINLEPLRHRINRALITNVAIELTEIVVIRVIDQVQNSIRQGDVARWMLQAGQQPTYVDINGINEVEAISQRLTHILVYKVLPSIRPEVDALLQHSVMAAVHKTPVYQGMQYVPGLNHLPDQLATQLVSEMTQNLYSALTAALEDPVGAELTASLLKKFGDAFKSEVQHERTLEEMEYLITALLEEVKLNYIKRVSSEDIDSLRAETAHLYAITQQGGQSS